MKKISRFPKRNRPNSEKLVQTLDHSSNPARRKCSLMKCFKSLEHIAIK